MSAPNLADEDLTRSALVEHVFVDRRSFEQGDGLGGSPA
jgi:hypothetical protein